MKDIEVKRIESKESYDFLLNKHYAGRIPSISYAFGLYINNVIEGVLTIGKPASNSLCKGVCGIEYSNKVYELNRLVVNDGLERNTLSFFVSRVLRTLKEEDLILVSYADTGMNHCGYIYQATNWIYTGATKERTDKYVPLGKHSRHYTDENQHLRIVRTSKHRYIYFTGKSRKKFLKILNYPIVNTYPKIDYSTYELGTKIKRKVLNKNTKETWYE